MENVEIPLYYYYYLYFTHKYNVYGVTGIYYKFCEKGVVWEKTGLAQGKNPPWRTSGGAENVYHWAFVFSIHVFNGISFHQFFQEIHSPFFLLRYREVLHVALDVVAVEVTPCQLPLPLEVHHLLVAVELHLLELDIPAAQHSLGMGGPSQWLNQVAVSGWRNTIHHPDGNIPWLEQTVTLPGLEVPQFRSIETGGKNVEQFHLDSWVHKMKFL
jgi:hypothetical protein